MKLKYSDIIRNQPTINIGIIGHVAHGKSTFTKSMTGTKTQKFSSEQERNITIHIGYANTKIFLDSKGILHTASSKTINLVDDEGNDMKLIKHISLVDCPGHEAYMANMISGSAIMDSSVLVVASNENVPQAQTYEHLQAVQNVNINDFIILQNKMDLVKEEENDKIYKDIKKFVKGTNAEKSIIIPSSIQNDINKDEVLKALVNMPEIDRKINEPARMIIIRSFDINKAHTPFTELSGGVIGGSLISGIFNLNDIVELRPGIVIKVEDENNSEETFKYRPITTTIRSLQSDTSKMDFALPGGLVGIGLDIDPSLAKSNGLIGQIVGYIGTLPDVYSAVQLDFEELKRYDNLDDSFKMNEQILISVNSMNIKGNILYMSKKKKKKYIKIQLEKPICVNDGQKVAIFKNILNRWILVAKSVINGGITCNIDDPDNHYEKLCKENMFKKEKIEIDYDLETNNYESSSYEKMLENIKFKSNSNYNIKVIPPEVKIINKETVFSNFENVCNSIKVDNDDSVNYSNIINGFIDNELSCSSQAANGKLVIKGKFKGKIFESVIAKFIKSYTKCKSCGSYKCKLIKENRNLFRSCLDCGSKSCIEK